MSKEIQKYIKEEAASETKNDQKEHLVAFRGNIERFELLNSKIRRLNSITERGGNPEDSRKDLKRVLNYVLEKKGIGGKNDEKSKAYFEVDGQYMVLVLNTMVNGKKNSSLDDLKKIYAVLAETDSILGSQSKIQKHRLAYNSLKENLDSLSGQYQKNTGLISRGLDIASAVITGESQIRGIYETSYEKTKLQIFQRFSELSREYGELTRSGNISESQRQELEQIKKGYEALLHSHLKGPSAKETLKNFIKNEALQSLKLGGIGLIGELEGFADATIIGLIKFIGFLFELGFNPEVQEATGKALKQAIIYFRETKSQKMFKDFLNTFSNKLKEISKEPPEKQGYLIGKIFGEIIGTAVGAKGFGKVLQSTPLKITWVDGVSSLEKVKSLNRVRNWKELKEIAEDIKKVNFAKNVETGGDVVAKDIRKALVRLEKGDTKALKDLPRGKIRDIAQQLLKNNGIIPEAKGISGKVGLFKKKTEIMIADRLIKGKELTQLCLKVLAENPNSFGFRFSGDFIEGLGKISRISRKFEEDISMILYKLVQKPMHYTVVPKLNQLKKVILESSASYAVKDMIIELDETIRLSKGITYAKKKVIFGSKDAFESHYHEGLAMVSKETRSGKLFGFKDANGVEIIEAKYKRLDLFHNDYKVAYFERGDHVGLVNMKGEEIYSIKKIKNHNGLLEEINGIDFEGNGRFKIQFNRVNNRGQVVESSERFGILAEGKMIEQPRFEKISYKEHLNTTIMKEDIDGVKKRYHVTMKSGERLEFETHRSLQLFVNDETKSVQYIDGNTLFKRGMDGGVEKIKFIGDPKKFPMTDISCVYTESGEICVLDAKKQVRVKLKARGKKSAFGKKPNEFGNVEFDGDFIKIRGEDGNIKAVHRKRFENGDGLIDPAKMEVSDSLIRVADNESGTVYLRQFEEGGKKKLELFTIDGDGRKKNFFSDGFTFESNLSRIKEGNNNLIVVKNHKDERYIIDLRNKTRSKLQENVDHHDLRFQDNGLISTTAGNETKENVLMNRKGTILSKDAGRRIKIGEKSYIIKSSEVFNNGDTTILTESGTKFLRNRDGIVILKTGTSFELEGKRFACKKFAAYDFGIAEVHTDKGDRFLMITEVRKEMKDGSIKQFKGNELLCKIGKFDERLGTAVTDFRVARNGNFIEVIGERDQRMIISTKGKVLYGPGEFKLGKSLRLGKNNQYDVNSVILKDGTKGYFLKDGTILGEGCDSIEYMSKGEVFALKKGMKERLVDKTGKLLYEFAEGENCMEYSKGVAIIMKDGRFGARNLNTGKMIVDYSTNYEDIGITISYTKNGEVDTKYITVISKENKMGAYLDDGTMVLEAKYDIITYDKERRGFEFMQGDTTGFIKKMDRKRKKIYSGDHSFRNTGFGLTTMEYQQYYAKSKESVTRTKATIDQSTSHLVGEDSKHLILDLQKTGLDEVMSGMVVNSPFISKSFDKLMMKVFKNHGFMDISIDLDATLNEVINAFKEQYVAKTGRKIGTIEKEYLEDTFKNRIKSEFIGVMNHMRAGERLPIKLTHSKIEYLSTIANLTKDKKIDALENVIDSKRTTY